MTINRIFLSLLLLSFSFNSFSQSKIYLNKLRQPCDKKSAVFIKKHERENGNKYYRIYHIAKNKLIFEAQLKSIDPEIKDGLIKEWNLQGILLATGYFKSNEKSGIWETFYSNKRRESIYEVRNDSTTLFHQIWNKYEKPLLINGTGIVTKKLKGFTDELKYQYKDSVLWKAYFISESSDTVYYKPKHTAAFHLGRKKLYNFLGNAVRYPPTALKLGVNGNVHLRFIIDKNGVIEKIAVTNGLGVGCDEEAIRVIMRTSGQWLPALFNNKPVNSIIELPVRFLLKKRTE